jgi:hypothetical protein
MVARKKSGTSKESASTTSSSRSSASGRGMEAVLQEALRKFEGSRLRREGTILIRFVGEDGGESVGDFHVHSRVSGCELSRKEGHAPPLIEIIGEPERIRAVLEGGREGLAQFYRGGIRIRGDLQYLSELAYELGFIREPFHTLR